MKTAETLEELANELDRVVGKAKSGQDIQLSRAETNQITKLLQELKALREVVFGDATEAATPEKLEAAAYKSNRHVLQELKDSDAVLALLFSKMQSLVRCRRECMELKDELRHVRDALSAIGVPFWLDDGLIQGSRFEEHHPTLAGVERLRSIVQELCGIISENEGRWDTARAFEAADLRMSIEIILEDHAAEELTKEEIVEKLQDIADSKYERDHESRTLITELTAPFREQEKVLRTAIEETVAALRDDSGAAANVARTLLLTALEMNREDDGLS